MSGDQAFRQLLVTRLRLWIQATSGCVIGKTAQRELSAFDTASELPAPSSIAILTQARKLAFLDYVCSREQRTSERIDSDDMSQI